MRRARTEIVIWLQVFLVLLIWYLVLLFSGNPITVAWTTFSKLPDVIAIYLLIISSFVRWGWRWPIFRGWLVLIPDLQGTWEGKLETTWHDQNAQNPPGEIATFLVIRQTFWSISCQMFTSESSSNSMAAQITQDASTDNLSLTFNYVNTPRAAVRARSEIHYGAAILSVVSSPERLLVGTYWTDRHTTGDVRLSFKSRRLVQTFPLQSK